MMRLAHTIPTRTLASVVLALVAAAALAATPAGDEEAWDALRDRLDELDGTTAAGIYELTEQPGKAPGIEPLFVLRERERLAIGSTFKLWILGTLAETVEAGDAAWDDKLPSRDEWKSLPSGRMQLHEAGEAFTLAHYALRMISESDNTATDHLMHHLGRERIEAHAERLGIDDDRHRPMLTTREMFILKGTQGGELLGRFIEAEEADRRAMVSPEGPVTTAEPDMAGLIAWSGFGPPRAINEVEWFASPIELARTVATLAELEQKPGMDPLAEAWRRNPGIPFDDAWEGVAFKGGSEPGVLNLTWLLTHQTGRRFVVTLSWNDPDRRLDDMRLIKIAGEIARQLDQSAGEAGREGPEEAADEPEEGLEDEAVGASERPV